MSWGTVFGKVAEQFQGRVERLKNEKRKLENELEQLKRGECDEKTAKRVTWINDRVNVIDGLLESNAKG